MSNGRVFGTYKNDRNRKKYSQLRTGRQLVLEYPTMNKVANKYYAPADINIRVDWAVST